MSRRLLFRLLASTPPATDHVTDAELLRRFAGSGDPAAFELLVRRHAGAVWAACRRVLPNDADAEDAFQATFLALLQSAKAVRAPSAGGWLHRVAVHAALKLRTRAPRVPSAEPQQLGAIPARPTEPPDTELAAVLHEELARLPERERLPVVLCDLEGLSHGEAAQTLGWPVGTVSGRLSRARAKLRARLERRGVTPAAGVLLALAPPPSLIPRALSLTTGTISPSIVSLTEGTLAMMKTDTRTWAALAAACAGLIGAGGAIALVQPGAQPAPAPNGAAHIAAEQSKTVEGDWTPKGIGDPVPTAFPGIKADAGKLSDVCPHLWGKKPAAVVATDTLYQRLLKARIHQCCLCLVVLEDAGRQGDYFADSLRCQADLLRAVLDLWASEPDTARHWLEELLVCAKSSEEVARTALRTFSVRELRELRLNVRTVSELTRHRLEVEAALLKGKSAK